jgi:hypothetical protein
VNVHVLDLKAASEFLSLSPRTIRGNISSIPHFTSPDGGKYLFRSDELLAWLERFRVRPVDLSEAHRIAESLTGGRRRHAVFSPSSTSSTPGSSSSKASVIDGGGRHS